VELTTPVIIINSFEQVNASNSLRKEGWLVFINSQNFEQNCWVTINNNFILSIKFSQGSTSIGTNGAQLSEDRSISIGNHLASSETAGVLGNLFVFTVNTTADEGQNTFRFGAQTKEEAVEWVSLIVQAHRQYQQQQQQKMQSTSLLCSDNSDEISVNVDNLVLDDNAQPMETSLEPRENNSFARGSAEEVSTHWSTDIDQTRLSDFEFHKVLGRGKFAQVILCSQKSSGKVYAVKIVNRNEVTGEENTPVDNESKILRSLVHPFIVGLHFAFQSRERLYLVMEYVNGGELFFHISNFGRFSEERVRFYSAEIMLAIEFLHSKGILYR
jgi:hypothetical protein